MHFMRMFQPNSCSKETNLRFLLSYRKEQRETGDKNATYLYWACELARARGKQRRTDGQAEDFNEMVDADAIVLVEIVILLKTESKNDEPIHISIVIVNAAKRHSMVCHDGGKAQRENCKHSAHYFPVSLQVVILSKKFGLCAAHCFIQYPATVQKESVKATENNMPKQEINKFIFTKSCTKLRF